ncbi:TIGR02611 family protein [Streptosporangium amethystogenes]|uniref:TIGR02611 family protein n=1 Tax=Streptosporangium amethystogenes TaxID=2002 RepID=UPI0037A10613
MAISDGVRSPQDETGRPSETGATDAPNEIADRRNEARGGRSEVREIADADVPKDEAARRPGIHGRLDGIRSTRAGRLTLKIVIGTIGAVLVIGGLIMVPFPGPGWLVVFAGLAVLATEFHWAHRLLEFGKRTLSAWTAWLGRQGWSVKILVVLAAAATATAIVYYGLKLSLDLDLIVEAQKLLIR